MVDVEELVLGKTRRISHIRRYGALPVVRAENVAEHSFYVAWYSLNIASELEKADDRLKGLVADSVRKAIVHDIEESSTSDVVRVLKLQSQEFRNALEKMSRTMVADLDNRLGQDGYINDLWERAKDESLSGQIVRLSDLLAVVGYAIEEIKCGNSYMHEVVDNVRGYLITFGSNCDQRLMRYVSDALSIVTRYTTSGR